MILSGDAPANQNKHTSAPCRPARIAPSRLETGKLGLWESEEENRGKGEAALDGSEGVTHWSCRGSTRRRR